MPLSPAEADLIFARLADVPSAAIAVSGGPDSLALLLLAHEWAGRAHPNLLLHVLTVDHALRAGSRAEAEAVAALCLRLGRPHRILEWTGHKPVANLQDAARRARYALLRAACLERGAGILMTAHHRDDQAETFLLALKRGSGVRGLAAMPVTRDLGGVMLFRPLLEVPKARLVASVAARGVAFARDPSNEDPRFDRARLRAARGALDALGFDAERLAGTARAMARADAALEAAELALLRTACMAKFSGHAYLVAIDALLDAPEEIGLRALSRLIRVVGGETYSPRLERLERLMAEIRAAATRPDKLRRTLGDVQIVLEPLAEGALRRLWLARESGRLGLGVLDLGPGETGLWGGPVGLHCVSRLDVSCQVREIGVTGAALLRRTLRFGSNAVPQEILAVLPGVYIDGELAGVPPVGWVADGDECVAMAPVAAPGRPADFLDASGGSSSDAPKPAGVR